MLGLTDAQQMVTTFMDLSSKISSSFFKKKSSVIPKNLKGKKQTNKKFPLYVTQCILYSEDPKLFLASSLLTFFQTYFIIPKQLAQIHILGLFFLALFP